VWLPPEALPKPLTAAESGLVAVASVAPLTAPEGPQLAEAGPIAEIAAPTPQRVADPIGATAAPYPPQDVGQEQETEAEPVTFTATANQALGQTKAPCEHPWLLPCVPSANVWNQSGQV